MKTLIMVAVFLLMTRQAGRSLRRQGPELEEEWHDQLRESRIQRVWKKLKRIFGSAAAMFLAIATLYGALGPVWHLAPDIQPRNPVDGSSLIIPFRITSKNILFPVKQVTLECSINLLFAIDAGHKTILVRDSSFKGGKATLSPSGVDYPCDASFLSIQPDGSLVMGYPNGTFMSTKPGANRGPLSILKLCVTITGTFDNWLGSGWRLPENLNQWPSAPGGHEWTSAPVVFDDEAKWIPLGSTIGEAYASRRVGDGNGHLLPGALTCDTGVGVTVLFSHILMP